MPPAPPPRPTPRWHRRPAVRPQEILEAAFHVFGTRGLHGATLEDVAREAGISKGTIYLYFPSKAALFSAMLRARVNDLMPVADARGDGRGDASVRERLAALGRELYRFFKSPAYLAIYRTVVSEAAQLPDLAATIYREGVLPANRRLAEEIRRGILRGEFREVDPLLAARAFVGMFQVFAISQGLLAGERILPIPEGAVVKTVTDVFFSGILAHRAPATARRRQGGSR